MANYHRGRADEYALRNMATRDGLAVVRAAGSYGSADLVAFDAESGRVFALDVKRNAWAGPGDRRTATDWYVYGVWPWLARCEKPGARRVWTFRLVGTDGSMGTIIDHPPWRTRALVEPSVPCEVQEAKHVDKRSSGKRR